MTWQREFSAGRHAQWSFIRINSGALLPLLFKYYSVPVETLPYFVFADGAKAASECDSLEMSGNLEEVMDRAITWDVQLSSNKNHLPIQVSDEKSDGDTWSDFIMCVYGY